jgi:hypothetical protein
MKRLITSLFFIALIVISPSGQSRYSVYENSRFAYSIEFPADLLEMQPESANGDGIVFVTKDRSIEMRVWGQFNPLNRRINDEYSEAIKRSDIDVTYKTLLKNGFVVSGAMGDKIYYQKTLYRPGSGGVFYTFTIQYPRAERAMFDFVVQRIAKSFKFDPTANV